jgi:hypothetical protein
MKLEHLYFVRRIALAVPFCAALGGCMTSSPIWEAHFGEAVKAASQAQIIDPQAAQHSPSTPGIDANSAVSAMTQYDKSYAQPITTANPYTIGVSSGSSSGSQ